MISLSAVVWKIEPLRSSSSRRTIGVDQVAVVRDRHLAADTIDHERLRIFQRARAGGGIAGVPDRARSFEFRQFFLPENLRDEPHPVVLEKCLAGAVARDDAGTFLPAMLERKETVVRQHRRVRMTEHAEESAFMLRKACGISLTV